jgi:putative hydrolase of the HAD superfamily
MQIYRRLTAIKAISFDLDDTLYNNLPVMLAIEPKMQNYFSARFAVLSPSLNKTFDRYFWAPYRHQALAMFKDIGHDVAKLRLETYRLGFLAQNMTARQAVVEAQAGVAYFIQLRSDFSVPPTSHKVLLQLQKKFPLIAISNGNVDTSMLGIDRYFQHIYHAGFQQSDTESPEQLLKQKPANDMFRLALKQLAILPEQLLHVGDCGFADVHGALNAGCQTAWLPKYGIGKPLRQIPHLELANIDELLSFV